MSKRYNFDYPIIYMKKVLLIVCCCLVQYSSISQSKLTGKIIDTLTKQPIAGASIFLSHTSIGTVSDERGEFLIQHIPQGKFEIIVSSLNYQPYITTIQPAQESAILSIQMSPSSNILKEVIVESYDKDGWTKWGDYFKANFIGTSSIAANCTLINHHAVRFKFINKANTVRAFAHEKLIFENRALGYNIKYLLSKFEFDISAKTFKFLGYPLFEKMVPKNSAEQKKWESARLSTYKGSLMHFMRSLFSNQLTEEGFEVRVMKKVTDEEKNRVRELYKRMEKTSKSNGGNSKEKGELNLNKDSLEYFVKVMKLSSDDDKVILDKLIPRDNLIFPVDSSVEPNAVFFEFSDYLHITYLHKKEPYEYTKFLLKKPDKDYISSDITLTFQKGVPIYKNGNYSYGENIFVYGYWAWSEKLSTILPIDYKPDENNYQ